MDFKDLYKKSKEGLRTVKGRNALTFFVFLVISTIFWFLMALNDEVQTDYRMPVKYTGFPRDMVILSGECQSVSVAVKDKGSAMMKFSWGRVPTLTCRYEDFTVVDDDHLVMNPAQLNTQLRGVFGAGATIISSRPDSMSLYYTTSPGVPVRVRLDADVHTSPQAVAFGRVTLSSDTVMLYSRKGLGRRPSELTTAPVILSGLKDTAVVLTTVQVPEGMRAIPSTIKVTIPVEPLVSKTRTVPVMAINVPKGSHLVTFPSMVEVTYLLPRSMYNSDTSPIKAFVDYHNARPGEKSLPLKLSAMPNYYQGASINPSTVDFVLEAD